MLLQTKKVKGFLPIAINIPAIRGQDVAVRGQFLSTASPLLQGKASSVSFDAETNQQKAVSDIAERSFADRFEVMVYRLHIGAYGGVFIRWLYILLGLTPGLLSVTGAALWLRRKKWLT